MQYTLDSLTDWTPSTNGVSSEEALGRQLELFVEVLQAQAGGPNGYRLRRILLTNFWLYGQQEFEIPHGRLFLAGENASGKSTVLTAALPLALDGDLRPNRLDTFGGRERHIDYYVLGGSDSATPYNHERRTSYIALEFEWCDPDHPPIAPEARYLWENGEQEKARFLTIGVSLAGNINASERIRPLRFLITDGSRLGYDLHTVYETGSRHDKRAFDHPRFKQQLEGHGIICETQAEYERQVARHLFGFQDARDFSKLINLLLVLRRPNLSSELSFSKVHDYLKQSLRKISGETTSHVIGTIERIDAIQAEKARLQESYNAAERLHQAQQTLVRSQALLAASDYLAAQLVEESIQHRVSRLRRDVLREENERDDAETRTQALQAEQYQVSGQVKMLEASEGLQVAKQLVTARERTRESRSQAELQAQSLEAARRSSQAHIENLKRQQGRFAQLHAESSSSLQALRSLAENESQWESIALQLNEALLLLQAISSETARLPEMPPVLTALSGIMSDERIAWLRKLDALHQQREKLEAQVQHARQLETTRFQELDAARQRFQAAQDRFFDAALLLDETLKPFLDDESALLPSITLAGNETADDETLPNRVVEACGRALLGYREAINTLEAALSQAAQQAQERLNALRMERGGRQRELEEVLTLYRQKESEPEYVPVRPERHIRARARLAESGIFALPFYMLLDFAPEIDCESEEAGRIECMLEDAGLLDALVVAPSQAAQADTLLALEGLSDCRLDIERLMATTTHQEDMKRTSLLDGLRFDSAAIEPENGYGWEALVRDMLDAITRENVSSQHIPLSASRDGSWTHGLLTGQAGDMNARLIGKTTRVRVRQRELAMIDEQRVHLEEMLRDLDRRIMTHEGEFARVQESLAQLRKALTNSGLERISAEIETAQVALESNRSAYQKARLQTQEIRQGYNALTAQLERESQGMSAFAAEQQRVQEALLGTITLKNAAQTLQAQLASLLNAWEEVQKSRGATEQAAAHETALGQLYERARYQALQAQAEEDELARIAASSDAEELSERLHLLRARLETLATHINEATIQASVAADRVSNYTNQLLEEEQRLQQAQVERRERQAHFAGVLSLYPVEELAAARQLAREEKAIAQHLLGGALREAELTAHKEQWQNDYLNAYNALSRAFNREQSILIEYGPDLDTRGQVLFLNENRCTPIELLERLSEQSEIQQTLLLQEETKLFEDFLLHEIAEAIRGAIFEAEEWVQQINGVLSGLPMIGEHYSLQWKPPTEYDMSKPGSHLAQYYRLLRKSAQALTAEETETLMAAFRQEIDTVRLRMQENADINFMDALEQVFDYREWFHFDVWVTQAGGQRQRLTDRVAGARSGAEQLFALYVPLFAALGALYRSAAHGAPRLMALDEAFDKVSVANTQRIIEFLVSQDFQWIMTGPHISGTGAKIPACARYLMIHEKGSPIATASAQFWSDSPAL